MEEDIDIDGYKEYKMPDDNKKNYLTDDLAKATKSLGYRDRLYSTSGIIVEGAEKNLSNKRD